MKHIIQTIKLLGVEARLVTTKVLDILAAPYWKLYNELTNRDFRRNPEKYTGDAQRITTNIYIETDEEYGRRVSEQIAAADLAHSIAVHEGVTR